MRYFLQISTLLIALLFIAPAFAKACSCISSGAPCQAVWNTDAVFSGEVKEIIDPPAKETILADGQKVYSYQRKKIRFVITEPFRGISGETVEVTTGRGGGDCGYPFVTGEKYLVYAYKNKETGELNASICSRTQLLAKATEDLEYLRNLATMPPGSTIYGGVFQVFPRRNDDPYRKPEPLAGIRVFVEGETGKNERRPMKRDRIILRIYRRANIKSRSKCRKICGEPKNLTR